MKRGIIFDLDGTLWDSSEEVAISWQAALDEHFDIEKPITAEMIQGVMGKSMYEISDILFSEFAMKDRREMLAYCCKKENEHIRSHGGILVEGLEETLQQLRDCGYHLSIVSNCQAGYIEAFLEYHKLEKYFDDFECFGRTGREKGRNIRMVVERNSLDRAVYVGDVQGDYYAAEEAGIPFIHAENGYGTIQAEVPAITDLARLPQVVEEIFNEQ
ncbi:HAD hydrolase, family IA [Eubacterium sp. 14-2]|uniref:HAD family hydrolase n=1 Tax=Eubacterium sp. 14-2 TaxID=1235790 RepID=UPI00033937DD|nr:HAD family hydrolase [Eubacterium sp. 14-2]EOT26673.1 HAD hydrolase, family IA [Eubacterium sp. 14-2]